MAVQGAVDEVAWLDGRDVLNSVADFHREDRPLPLDCKRRHGNPILGDACGSRSAHSTGSRCYQVLRLEDGDGGIVDVFGLNVARFRRIDADGRLVHPAAQAQPVA